MTVQIHPSAVIHENAKIGDGSVIGPFCVIGEHVTLGANVELKSHVVVDGLTEIGEGTIIFPFASLGTVPQDLKFGGEQSQLIIGKNNRIREHVTMNPGTSGGGMVTKVGDNCLFMVGSHVAHDCIIGNNVIVANNGTIAGHVIVEDFVVIGGLAAIHQFVRIGAHAMIGGMSGVEKDVIPYAVVTGERAHLNGLNFVGLTRRGFSKDEVRKLRRAYRSIFEGEGAMKDRLTEVEQTYGDLSTVQRILEFIDLETSRGLCTPK